MILGHINDLSISYNKIKGIICIILQTPHVSDRIRVFNLVTLVTTNSSNLVIFSKFYFVGNDNKAK